MHQIQCKCGTIRGQLDSTGISSRVVCYCADCQAFAEFLGKSNEVLDVHGGTEIVQVAQPCLSFSQGQAHLAAVQLSEKGMVRWYAACCNTPIGNTLINPKVSFIGVIHSCLDRAKMDRDFGKNVAEVNTNAAIGEPKPKQRGILGVMLRFIGIVLTTRIGGRYRKSPLFNESGAPIVRPRVLLKESERQTP
jgi:hypothetical protein